MATISIDDLQERHERLTAARRQNLDRIVAVQTELRALQEKETGFKFVIGELEAMIEELTALATAEASATQFEKELQGIEGEHNAAE